MRKHIQAALGISWEFKQQGGAASITIDKYIVTGGVHYFPEVGKRKIPSWYPKFIGKKWRDLKSELKT
jgi:hypothetical protein